MSKNLIVGDRVFVPLSKTDPEFQERPMPFFETKITEVINRSVRVALPNGQNSPLLGSASIHRNIGILILQIGDFQTETPLLVPLTKTILQYCRLLLGYDTYVLSEKCRSFEEFAILWQKHANLYKHIILIGHGTKDSLHFGIDGDVKAKTLRKIISLHVDTPKSFISLCCKTGQKGFAGVISKCEYVESFVGPFDSIHGAIASQFTQTYLANHLLNGLTDKTAFNRTIRSIAGKTIFRFWENGRLKT